MRIRLFFALLSILSLASAVWADAPRPYETVLNDALARGEIGEEEALLNRFRFAFAPERISVAAEGRNVLPVKSMTLSVWNFQERKDALSPAVVEEIEGYLRGNAGVRKTLSQTYDSPGGHFRLTYETSGSNAVPLTDTNPANGIPDYVERVAVYCDSSWTREVEELGFNAPALDPGEKYAISFENMGSYGYTSSDGHG